MIGDLEGFNLSCASKVYLMNAYMS